jgi:hypothetical protein
MLLAAGCSSAYKALVPAPVEKTCAERMRPKGIATSWYTAGIDVVGKHLSGLLLVKEMPDSSRRVVFTNEAGITFLDFEFSASGAFQAKQVIKQLDHKAVVELLRKDFALMLGIPFQHGKYAAWLSDTAIFYGVPQKKETAYFITDRECASLQRLELGSKRKRKVTIVFSGADLRQPAGVTLQHYTFNMVIVLKKLER